MRHDIKNWVTKEDEYVRTYTQQEMQTERHWRSVCMEKEKSRTFGTFYLQKMGVEPTRYCYHTDLNRARLPIPPLLHEQ